MKFENKTILILSNEPWGDIWYSKQNYAYELSRRNKVYFINPPVKWKLKNLFVNPIRVKRYDDNLSIVNYQNFLPILNPFVNRINNYMVSIYLRNFFYKTSNKKFIFWTFDTTRLYDPELFKAEFSIYHCVDLYAFKFIGEKLLCQKADVIIANSSVLLEPYKSFGKPMFVVPHAISEEEFEVSDKELQYLDINFKEYGLWIGIIDERIDFQLLEKILIAFPDTDFVFVGPLRIKPGNPLANKIFVEKAFRNLHLLGTRHFKKLKLYVKKAKFCLFLMDKDYPGNDIAHHKTLVYLTQGKPVFGYRFYEYRNLDELIYMSETHEGILEKLNHFLQQGESSHLVAKRIVYAKKFTFDEAINKIETFIQSQK